MTHIRALVIATSCNTPTSAAGWAAEPSMLRSTTTLVAWADEKAARTDRRNQWRFRATAFVVRRGQGEKSRHSLRRPLEFADEEHLHLPFL
jgi:hypothetical protein